MALLGVTPLAAARWSEATPQAGAGVSVVDSELRLYGPVVSGAEAEMFGLESFVTDTGAREALDGMEGDITVALNSPGGDVWAGVAIHSALTAYSGAVNIRVDGVAASIAALIAMAGNQIEMAELSQMMVHGAWGCMCGNAGEMRNYADLLDETTGQFAGRARQAHEGLQVEDRQDAGRGRPLVHRRGGRQGWPRGLGAEGGEAEEGHEDGGRGGRAGNEDEHAARDGLRSGSRD